MSGEETEVLEEVKLEGNTEENRMQEDEKEKEGPNEE